MEFQCYLRLGANLAHRHMSWEIRINVPESAQTVEKKDPWLHLFLQKWGSVALIEDLERQLVFHLLLLSCMNYGKYAGFPSKCCPLATHHHPHQLHQPILHWPLC